MQVERISEVRTSERITEAIAEAAARKATVLYSIVSADQRKHLLHEARRHHVFTIDLLGPILRRLSDVLDVSPRAEAGLFRQLDDEYFRRIEAIEFAVKHDDGKVPGEIASADLVLVGVSRTSKTPLSMFLAYRGWRVANVPIVLGIDRLRTSSSTSTRPRSSPSARPRTGSSACAGAGAAHGRGVLMTYAEIEHITDELGWFQRIVGAAAGPWSRSPTRRSRRRRRRSWL